MILYEETIERFNEDVMQNCIADRAAEKYHAYYKRKPGDSEYRAWTYSLAILNNSFRYAGLKGSHIIVEYELPYSSRRIDVLLFGKGSSGKENIVLMELKQWSNENVDDCDSEGNVIVDYGKFKKEQAHPALQVQGYHFGLKDFLEIFESENAPELSSCAYAHNYSREEKAVLFMEKFSEAIKTFPLFGKEDATLLGNYLKERLQKGGGRVVFERFAGSAVRPSKKLLDHTSEMINNRQIFNLIDEQIVAYNSIMHRAKQLTKTKRKSAVIVRGGPGTGKSVIALEVMGELLRQGRKVMHATGSKAFTETLRKIVGTRAKSLFKFFNSFGNAEENSIDVLVADEAHRIRETSNNRFTRKESRSGSPQIDELFKLAKLSIFFIDENQIVRPNEIGSVELIKRTAEKFGIHEAEVAEFELKTQFRCSGSDAYLQWLDHVLEIRETELTEFDAKMEFRIFASPLEMMEEIRKRNQEKENSARITAGFCWPWSEPNRDGSLVNDVKIGDFEMPWEQKNQFWKWATDDSGMEQVGTVYTAQGFEFDYIAVIFGNDLVLDETEKKWKAIPQNSSDSQVKRNNQALTRHLKNVYRVLLSRAHKGVYVYFMDKGTETYFRNHMPEIK
ncbi:MAG: DUF2075 domain-containing protein [Candidatus Jorgensenbacteria bacterium]|nr:DUF2075 domain-containing protein [Candidatus Jorgensenbacteria bacterium]